MLQTKEQEKSLKTKLNEMKISYLPEREFKIVVIKILTKVRRAMHEQNENFNTQKIFLKIQAEIIELNNKK